MSRPIAVQRIEGLALLVLAVVAFAATGFSWWWFAALLLVPDVSMVGYLVNPRAGAAVYNAGHTLVLPVVLAIWWWVWGPSAVGMVAAVWLAHIGMDRAAGYGLKEPTDFTHTHLGLIGPSRNRPGGGALTDHR